MDSQPPRVALTHDGDIPIRGAEQCSTREVLPTASRGDGRQNRDSSSGPAFANVSRARSDLRLIERVGVLANAPHIRQATLALPDRQRTLQGLARLAHTPRALEHQGEVLVAPPLKPDVVRLCLRGGYGGTCQLLCSIVGAGTADDECLHRRDKRSLHRSPTCNSSRAQ